MVIVLAEYENNQVKDTTYELVALGKELADKMGKTLSVVAIGNSISGSTSSFGHATEVITVEDPSLENFVPDTYNSIYAKIIGDKGAQLVLVNNSSVGGDISSYLASKLSANHMGYCTNLDFADGKVVGTSLLYGGKLSVSSNAEGLVICSMLPGSRKAENGKSDGSPEVVAKAASEFDTSSKITFKTLHLPDDSDVDISQQEILVSIGRGIQDESNIEMAEELAELLGGVVSASRPIIDQGWLAKTRQVGKSGKTVKPKLYLALGISGAPEHVEGMGDAELIIAVNTDENAPIFDLAHYGITADLFDFVPELIDALDG